MEWIYIALVLTSALAAILAWIAKIRWSKEFSRAKEAQIELLNNHIKNLEQLSPMKVREYFNSMKEQLEEYNDRLKEQLDEAHNEIKKQKEINKTQNNIFKLNSKATKLIGDVESFRIDKENIDHAMLSSQ